MIKKSTYERELSILKKRYGAENIITMKNSSSIMIKNFRPPEFFKVKETVLYVEITEGYGFGVSPMNSFILLPEECQKFHLFEAEGNFIMQEFGPDFEKFQNKIQKIAGNKKWFWICFHFHDKPPAKVEGGDDDDDKFDFVGIVEYVSAIYLVLQRISKGDPEIMMLLKRMAVDYEKAARERKKLVKMFKLELNWKKIKWMY